jgi:hypothetical protein
VVDEGVLEKELCAANIGVFVYEQPIVHARRREREAFTPSRGRAEARCAPSTDTWEGRRARPLRTRSAGGGQPLKPAACVPLQVPGTTRWNRRVRAHIEAAMAAPIQAPVEAMSSASSREMAAMRRTMACGTARVGPWRRKRVA